MGLIDGGIILLSPMGPGPCCMPLGLGPDIPGPGLGVIIGLLLGPPCIGLGIGPPCDCILGPREFKELEVTTTETIS